jgi:hypothetical protein
VFSGFPHGFRAFSDSIPQGKQWDEVINEGIAWILGQPVARKLEIKKW